MRNDYQVYSYGAGGLQAGHSLNVPDWADFLEVVNDGGRPVIVHFGGAVPVTVRTGARLPLLSRSLRCLRDASESAYVTGGAFFVAVLSSKVAEVCPPPLRAATRFLQTREVIVQANPARLVTYREGHIESDLRSLQGNGQAFYVADTEAKATAALGIEMQPGDIINAWVGPLWVFNPAGVNVSFDHAQRVKDTGGFSP